MNKELQPLLEENAEIEWWTSMRKLLEFDPTDQEFRKAIELLWPQRPFALKENDHIIQGGLHNGVSVGDHEYRVLMELQTDNLSNGDAIWARIVALGHDFGKREDPADPLHPRISALTVDDHMRHLGIVDIHRQRLHELIEHHHFWGNVVLGISKIEDARKIFPDYPSVMISHAVSRADVSSIDLLRLSGAVEKIDLAVEEAIRVNRFW